MPEPFVHPSLWFVLDTAGTVRDCHSSDPMLLQLPPEHFVGRALREVMPPPMRAHIDEALRRACQDGTSRLAYELSTPAGQRWFEADLVHLVATQQIVATVTDATAAREAHAARERLDGFVALLMRLAGRFINLPLPALDTAVDAALADTGRFVDADRAYLFRYDLGLRLGINTHEWCNEGITPQIAELQAIPMDTVQDWLHAHLRGELVHVPDVLALPAGNLRDILEPQGVLTTVALPLFGEAGCSGFVGFDFVRATRTLTAAEIDLLRLFAQMLVNVGERSRAEAARAALNASLEQRVAERTQELALAKHRAETADRGKSELMARVSHELRTPLNAVLGFAQLLSLDEAVHGAPAAAGQVEQIRRAGVHLLQMVDEVLDLARAEAGQLRLKPEPLDLVQLATEALSLAAPLALPEGLALHGPAPAAAIWVEADPTRLRQVLMNLLSNAIKYNRRGGWVRLTLDAPAGAAQARLSVHDSGLGLDAQQLRGLFEPFNRVGAEHSSVEDTGLGLAIARRLLRLMGGDLHADSVPGEGSCFTLELPCRAEPTPREAGAPAPDAEAAEPPHGGPLATRPLEVLYVEDNPVNVALMEAMLARPECGPVRLRTARDGPSGLAMTLAEPPDLLLLDLNLPGLSGTELLRQIRAVPALASVRGVAVSANAMSADIEAALEAGFDDYITKPFALERLAALVQCQRVRRASAP